MEQCSCCNGHGRIWDSSSYEPHAMLIFSAIDSEDYSEAWMRLGRCQGLGSLMEPLDYERHLYECPECGRLLIESREEPGTYYLYVPEHEGGPLISGPAAGERYRRMLSGSFDPSETGVEGRGRGLVHEYTGGGEDCHRFKTLEETQSFFNARMKELRENQLLEEASFWELGKITYRWKYEDTLPKQSKMELFFSDFEQEAIAEFKTKHELCKWHYPYPEDGGQFEYTVIPKTEGTGLRTVRVSCRFCGSHVESDGTMISHGGPAKPRRSESER